MVINLPYGNDRGERDEVVNARPVSPTPSPPPLLETIAATADSPTPAVDDIEDEDEGEVYAPYDLPQWLISIGLLIIFSARSLFVTRLITTTSPQQLTTNKTPQHPNNITNYKEIYIPFNPQFKLPYPRKIILDVLNFWYIIWMGCLVGSFLLDTSVCLITVQLIYNCLMYLGSWLVWCGCCVVGFIWGIICRVWSAPLMHDQPQIELGSSRLDWHSALLLGLFVLGLTYYVVSPVVNAREWEDNIPDWPNKWGYKSMRHYRCKTRKRRRENQNVELCCRNSLLTSWLLPSPNFRNPLPFIRYWLPFLSVVLFSQLNVVNLLGRVVSVVAVAVMVYLSAQITLLWSVGCVNWLVAWSQQYNIYLRGVVNGRFVYLDCRGINGSVTVGELKNWIGGEVGVSSYGYELGYDGNILWDRGTSLADYNIGNGCVLTIHIPDSGGFGSTVSNDIDTVTDTSDDAESACWIEPVDEEIFSVQIKTITGSFSTKLKVSEFDTVLDIKSSIRGLYKAPPTAQRLNFAGQMLEDERSLVSYGIRDGAVIFLTLPLVGAAEDEGCPDDVFLPQQFQPRQQQVPQQQQQLPLQPQYNQYQQFLLFQQYQMQLQRQLLWNQRLQQQQPQTTQFNPINSYQSGVVSSFPEQPLVLPPRKRSSSAISHSSDQSQPTAEDYQVKAAASKWISDKSCPSIYAVCRDLSMNASSRLRVERFVNSDAELSILKGNEKRKDALYVAAGLMALERLVPGAPPSGPRQRRPASTQATTRRPSRPPTRPAPPAAGPELDGDDMYNYTKLKSVADALDFSTVPRMTRTDDTKEISIRKKEKHPSTEVKALILLYTERVMRRSNLAERKRKQVRNAVAKVLMYDHGYKAVAGITNLESTWGNRLDNAFQTGTDTNPLGNNIKGKVSYVVKFTAEHGPGSIRQLFRSAQDTIGNQANYTEIANCMNEKASANGWGETKFKANNVRKWFLSQGGKTKSPKEKPYLTADQKVKRKEWCEREKTRMADAGSNFYACFLDEKWFYTTSRRRRLKILPAGEGEDPDEVRPFIPTTRSRRFAEKVMYLGVVANPNMEQGFNGKIFLKRVSKQQAYKEMSHNQNFSDDAGINGTIKDGKWKDVLPDDGNGMTLAEMREMLAQLYDLDDDIRDRLVIRYYTGGTRPTPKYVHQADAKLDGWITPENCTLMVRMKAGDVREVDVSCDSKFMTETMPQVGKAIRDAYTWVPRTTPIYLYLDNAGGHGTKDAVAAYVKALEDDYNVICVHQRPRSPPTNMLDLGVWMALQSVVEKMHFRKRVQTDALARTVESSWAKLEPIKLTNVWNRWKMVLDLIIEDNGGDALVEAKRGKLYRTPTAAAVEPGLHDETPASEGTAAAGVASEDAEAELSEEDIDALDMEPGDIDPLDMEPGSGIILVPV